jgi:hypothetical protein
VKRRPLAKGGAADGLSRSEQQQISPSAPEPQAQLCAAYGRPGHPPVIGAPKPNDLTIKPFLGRLALLCRECITCAVLDRAARRSRP